MLGVSFIPRFQELLQFDCNVPQTREEKDYNEGLSRPGCLVRLSATLQQAGRDGADESSV